MTEQMAKCVALRHEERVVSPITNARLNCQMHHYFNESQATLTSFTPGAWEGEGERISPVFSATALLVSH